MDTDTEHGFYPDDIFPILIAADYNDDHGNDYNQNISPYYILPLDYTNFIFSLIPFDSELIHFNEYSGNIYIILMDFINIYYQYYTSNGYSKKSAIDEIHKLLTEIYRLREDIVRYAIHLAMGQNIREEEKYGFDKQKRDIRNIIDRDMTEEALIDITKPYDNISDEFSELKIIGPNIISQDWVYYYAEKSKEAEKYNFERLPLNETVALISYLPPATEGSKSVQPRIYRIYEFSNDLEQLKNVILTNSLLEEEGLFVALYDDKKYTVGKFKNNRLITESTPRIEKFKQELPQSHYDEEVNITASWSLYDVEIDIELLLYNIMNNTEFSGYFLMKENEKPIFMKSQNNITALFRSASDNVKAYNLNINMQKLPSSIDYKEDRIPEGTYYITFTLSGIDNIYILDSLIRQISVLITRFSRDGEQDKIITRIRKILPDWNPTYLTLLSKTYQYSDKSLITKLQSIDKDKFPEGYARKCSKEKQVDIIDESEVEDWDRRVGEDIGARAMTFPKKSDAKPGELVLHLVCRDSEYRYPGVELNSDLPNRDKYPYIPCCFKESQYDKKSHLMDYLNDTPALEDLGAPGYKGSSTDISRIDKILPYGRPGIVPDFLSRSFRYHNIRKYPSRFGSIRSVNSLLHCVMYAVAHPGYIEMGTAAEMDLYVSMWRRLMGGADLDEDAQEGLSPEGLERLDDVINSRDYLIGAMCQEFYDYNPDKIREMISDPFALFDSLFMTRLLELYFHINLYVFTVDDHGNLILEVPRSKNYYVKNLRTVYYNERSNKLEKVTSVVLFKNITKSQYELITFSTNVDRADNSGILSDDEDIANMHKMFTNLYSTNTLMKSFTGDVSSAHNDIVVNVFSNICIYEILLKGNIIPIGQFVDVYGKCRGFQVIIPFEDEGIEGSILCLPQQPVELPIVTAVTSLPLGLVLSTFSMDGFGPNISHSDVNNDQLIGLWIAVSGYKLAMYVPIISPLEKGLRPGMSLGRNLIDYASRIMQLPRAGNPLIPTTEDGPFSQFLELESSLDTFLQILTALYRAYARPIMRTVSTRLAEYVESEELDGIKVRQIEEERIKSLMTFSNLFEIDTKVRYNTSNVVIPDSILSYGLNSLLRVFDTVTTSTVVRNGKIIMQSQKLLEDMKYYLTNFLINQPEEFYDSIKPSVGELKIFRSAQQLIIWINKRLYPDQVIDDAQNINIKDETPIIYASNRGITFMIQNVEDGDIARAVNVSLQWNSYGINEGYHAAAVPLTDKSYNVFEILGREIVLVDAPRNESDNDILRIITPVGEIYYAALLLI